MNFSQPICFYFVHKNGYFRGQGLLQNFLKNWKWGKRKWNKTKSVTTIESYSHLTTWTYGGTNPFLTPSAITKKYQQMTKQFPPFSTLPPVAQNNREAHTHVPSWWWFIRFLLDRAEFNSKHPTVPIIRRYPRQSNHSDWTAIYIKGVNDHGAHSQDLGWCPRELVLKFKYVLVVWTTQIERNPNLLPV